MVSNSRLSLVVAVVAAILVVLNAALAANFFFYDAAAQAQQQPTTTATDPAVHEARVREILNNNPEHVNNPGLRWIAEQVIRSESLPEGMASFVIYTPDSSLAWSGVVTDSDFTQQSVSGIGPKTIDFKCDSTSPYLNGMYSNLVQNQAEHGAIMAVIAQDGYILRQGVTATAYGIVSVAGECLP
jgi:hypothetical protein